MSVPAKTNRDTKAVSDVQALDDDSKKDQNLFNIMHLSRFTFVVL